MKTSTEYSIVGNKIEEHFETYTEAKNFFNSLPKKSKSKVQFFSKEWIKQSGEWIEGTVLLFSNFQTLTV